MPFIKAYFAKQVNYFLNGRALFQLPSYNNISLVNIVAKSAIHNISMNLIQ